MSKCGWCHSGFAVKYGGAENQCRCLREAHLCKCHANCEGPS
ncbi:hypothetical protein LCGC14_0921110 [marine sediment metagenome]|uniref:Uncharacterized protein n=1 Tax=marine sediment metagenome TaxID=412755 RepID=A0A0F9PBJ6_9ZZZZ